MTFAWHTLFFGSASLCASSFCSSLNLFFLFMFLSRSWLFLLESFRYSNSGPVSFRIRRRRYVSSSGRVICCISGSQNGKKCKKYPISSKNRTLFFSRQITMSQLCHSTNFLFLYLFSFTILILVISFFILILKIIVAFPVPVSQKVAKNTRFCRKIWLFFSRQITMSQLCTQSFNILLSFLSQFWFLFFITVKFWFWIILYFLLIFKIRFNIKFFFFGKFLRALTCICWTRHGWAPWYLSNETNFKTFSLYFLHSCDCFPNLLFSTNRIDRFSTLWKQGIF